MNIEKQVCSLELAEKLHKLMPRNESLFAYYGNGGSWHKEAIVEMAMYKDVDDDFKEHKLLPAYTAAELGEMLPHFTHTWIIEVVTDNDRPEWRCEFRPSQPGEIHNIDANTEADARAKMLIYLLENKLITKGR